MSEYCVVVAEGAQARIFTLEPAEIPEMQSGPNLVERKTLRNRQQEASPSDIRRGRNRAAYGPGHTYEEGRNDRETHKKFARRLADEIGRLIRANGFQHLVLCADKRTLGTLRPSLGESVGNGIDLHEVPKDLLRLNPIELHDRLASEGHLPRRRRRPSA